MQDFFPLSLVLFTLLARLKSPFPFLLNAFHALPIERKKCLLKLSQQHQFQSGVLETGEKRDWGLAYLPAKHHCWKQIY